MIFLVKPGIGFYCSAWYQPERVTARQTGRLTIMTTHISNIILADDDEDDCLLFQDVILDLNIVANITIARHGEELLHILQNYNGVPEVIFLDMNMPLRDGLECLKEIRKSQSLKIVPVIILSTSSHSQTVEDVFKEGANLYIRKPDSFDKLRSILENVLTRGTGNLTRRQKEEFLITE
jgi:CheY-like chemotaxis protein